MSKIEMLRLLITQRLTEAAEEIFGVFGRTIAEYEEEISRAKMEISRQRRLLHLSRKPRVHLSAAEQSWSSSVDQAQTTSPPIKEEEEDGEEEEGAELWLHQQEESDANFLLFQKHERVVDGAASSLRQPPGQDPEDPEADRRPGPSERRTGSDLDDDDDDDAPEASAPAAGNGRPDCEELSEVVDSYICTICGRAFAQRGHWAKHVQVHRKVQTKADKSYTCDICGKRLTRFDGYQKHLRIHTGEKPYSCAECGRRFSDNSNFKRHIRTHAGTRTLLRPRDHETTRP